MKSAGNLFFLSVFALWATPGTCASKDEACPLSPKAIVDDACVSYATLDKLNARVKPAVDDLTTTTDFFSHYRLNLFHKSCPFWDDQAGLCGNIGCAVETLDNEDDIPDVWKVRELSKLEGPLAKHPGRAPREEHRPLHGELGEAVGESCVYDNDDECDDRDYCVPEDESAFSKGDYVSLVNNPERFTGYSGAGARMVWDAIYRENCFQRSSFPHSANLGTSQWPQGPAAMDFKQVMEAAGRQAQLDRERLEKPETPFVASTGLEADDECLEKRVFYRVVSGMHASISTHLCWDYLNKTTGVRGPNLDCFLERLHGHADRISNLYFNYALVTRAVAKLGPFLQKSSYTFCTDDTQEDASTRSKVLKVAQRAALVPNIFDESLMFVNGEGPSLKDDFRNRFRNISRLMDCVGCDKCRLWGKLQTNGYGTALKVLFEFDESSKHVPVLKRTELVALFNTYGRLTQSLMAIGQFRKMAVDAEAERKAAKLLADTVQDIKDPLDYPHASHDPNEELSDELVDLIRRKNRGSGGNDWKSQLYHELALFKLALRVVFTGWIRAPYYFVQIAISEVIRFARSWMGLGNPERGYSLRIPNVDRPDLLLRFMRYGGGANDAFDPALATFSAYAATLANLKMTRDKQFRKLCTAVVEFGVIIPGSDFEAYKAQQGSDLDEALDPDPRLFQEKSSKANLSSKRKDAHRRREATKEAEEEVRTLTGPGKLSAHLPPDQASISQPRIPPNALPTHPEPRTRPQGTKTSRFHRRRIQFQWPHPCYEAAILLAPARRTAVMTSSSSSSTLPEPPRRPRLLAQNRKLRHLRGLSLRNLSFARPAHILRSADDGDLPSSSSRSTAGGGGGGASARKLAVLQESSSDIPAGAAASQTTLHPSRSSENLARLEPVRRPSASYRAGLAPVQRRASLSNAHSSPTSRQKKLEDLADEAVGDVFFSLHDPASPEEPVYISEVGERSANFDFRFFNLSTHQTSVARSCRVLVRIWTRRPKHTSWSFLLEELIDLRSLHFISTTLNREYRPNALVFHLEDGVYSLDFPDRISKPRQAPPMTTSSYNALMKLSNLESSIRDAQETQRTVTQQMSDIISAVDPEDEGADAAEEGVVLAGKHLTTQRRLNRQSEKRRDELRASLRTRREAMAAGRALQKSRAEDMESSREKLLAAQRLLDDTEQQIRGQRRRICADLSAIFPISPVPQAPPLSFQICGLPLPNSVYDAAVARTIGEDALSAALGLVALLARHLQFYLSHPLPYTVSHLGSRSYIRDDISHLADDTAGKTVGGGRREFPLFLPRGGSTTGQWRFEYAWFLLNKNLEALCASQALRVVDIRHTLPNLKYLLYVGSAGRDEMPERKKGGVRGLWAGRIKNRMLSTSSSTTATSPLLRADDDDAASSTTAGSRPGSADSEAHARRGDVLRSAALADHEHPQPLAMGWGAPGGGGGGMNPDFSLPLGSAETKFTLRTKGLRENVAR